MFTENKLDDKDEGDCQGCDLAECQCETLLWNFRQTNIYLQEMELLDCFIGNSITSMIHQQINSYIKSTCTGYDESHIYRLENVSIFLSFLKFNDPFYIRFYIILVAEYNHIVLVNRNL